MASPMAEPPTKGGRGMARREKRGITSSLAQSRSCVLAIAPFLLILLSGCSLGDPESALIGRWAGTCGENPVLQVSFTFEFMEDGRITIGHQGGSSEGDGGRYRVDGDNITFTTINSEGKEDTATGGFAVTDNTLQLTALTDPGNRGALVAWCSLTRMH
ncbi:hypothetical protein [Pseudonocardia acidicola]|uniref:Lipocalin-like domain-containing protein n=1 Tax=Pseudonocardia acidicola TaxID=2724939 RepID=A0ABX1S8L6_9PSEU|nr:hypothetical protein [Pseudonocardia acidicola]NMH96604.1 hypothetical protein [Pseudonocardia acidicola]